LKINPPVMINRILSTGISDQNQESLNKKIRLHNLTALFIAAACFTYIPFYLQYELFFLLKTSLLIIGISITCIFLQRGKRPELAFGILIFSTMILLNVISLYFGLITNMHFFHICSCMTAITLFDKNKLLKNIIIGFSLLSFFGLLIFLQNRPGLGALSEELAPALKVYGYINYFVLFVFTVVFFTSVIRQNALFHEKILAQNTILEYKNKQITDSIKYAKHIQDAMLPANSAIKEHLEESFILYKPKDIVAGDFYWMEAKGNNQVLFAAGDSTGHGVPGAMVSVVCTHALNQAVKEFDLKEPGQILDKARELVTSSFQHNNEEEAVTDGMDVSLCLLNTRKRTLKWAGANNPLWIIKKDSDEITVIQPDKQAVAKTEAPQPFTTHSVQLDEGDCFYLFTDGYADQFGGKSAKKYMQKRLKELLLSICKKPMDIQRKLINENLNSWMGSLEQVDDICFIGVKLS
jgi:serine phosphatase RsbU (regulator of sigma subunit)